jgi:drug/metabolite transporter (DMT)-like permease
MTRPGRDSAAAGLAAGTAAGLIWGLAFLLPVLLHGWTAVSVTVGRYIAYGLVSLLLAIVGGRGIWRLARQHWRPAVIMAITGNVGYYLLLVIGIELAGAPVTDIVIGCIPVALAIAGNFSSRTYSWNALIAPVTLVMAGLLLVNAGEFTAPGHRSVPARVLGLFAACGADALWTYYGLANARFLGRNPGVPNAAWSTVVGLGTGAVTAAALPLALLTHQLGRTSATAAPLAGLIGASLVLGIAVSWAATSLWNLTCARLSTTAAGMLVNVETISGYAYVYAARGQWPPASQLMGFALILLGVTVVVLLRPRPAPAPATAIAQRARAPGHQGAAGSMVRPPS